MRLVISHPFRLELCPLNEVKTLNVELGATKSTLIGPALLRQTIWGQGELCTDY